MAVRQLQAKIKQSIWTLNKSRQPVIAPKHFQNATPWIYTNTIDGSEKVDENPIKVWYFIRKSWTRF